MLVATLSPNSRDIRLHSIDDTLENWYQLLDCRTIEIHQLIDGSPIVFVCDEEGKLNGSPVNLQWCGDILCGTLGFARHNHDSEDGFLSSLMPEDLGIVCWYVRQNALWNFPDVEEVFPD